MRCKIKYAIVGVIFMCLAIVRVFKDESVFSILLDVALALAYLYLAILGDSK